MNRVSSIFVVALLTLSLIAVWGGSAVAAKDDGGQQHVNRVRVTAENTFRHQVRTQTQQSGVEAVATTVAATVVADQDRDRLQDGTGDGVPDRDQDQLRIRLMECVDQLIDWLRTARLR